MEKRYVSMFPLNQYKTRNVESTFKFTFVHYLFVSSNFINITINI